MVQDQDAGTFGVQQGLASWFTDVCQSAQGVGAEGLCGVPDEGTNPIMRVEPSKRPQLLRPSSWGLAFNVILGTQTLCP